MDRLLSELTDWLIHNHAISSDDKELYEYAIYSFIISTVPLVIFLVISGIIGMFPEGFLIIMPFMVIRKFGGGYHAKHAYICMIMSTGLLAGGLYAVSHFSGSRLIPLFLLVSGISIAINSPIDHENKRLTEQEKARYQRTTIVLVLAACFVSVVMNVMGYNRYSSCVALGVILTGVLQLPVIIRKIMR